MLISRPHRFLGPRLAASVLLLFALAACSPGGTSRDAGRPTPEPSAGSPRAVPASEPTAQEANPGPAPAAKTELPAAPARVRATAQSTSAIAVSWDASAPGPVTYEVLRGGVVVQRTEGTTAVDPALRPGTRYCYAVRASAAGQVSPSSDAACALTLDSVAPTPPANVVVAALPGGVAQLSWKPSADDVEVVGYEVFRAEARIASIRVPAFREENLAPVREHCWTVKALDGAGNRSLASEPACVTIPDSTPPTPPQPVTAVASGERTVDLVWGESRDDVGVARYEVSRTDAQPLVATGTSVRVLGLRPARRHCFSVRACDEAGNCSAPAPEACATTPDLTPPSRPGSPVARAASDRAIDVSWEPSTDEVGVVGYEVRRDELLVAGNLAGRTFADGGLRPAVRFCYSVVALDAAGNRSSPASACATTPDLTPPSSPERPSAAAISASQVVLGWEPSSDDVGVAGYEVLRSGAVVATVPTTSLRARNLPPNTDVCYSVRAFDASGNRSEPAGPVCARTPDPSVPSSPTDLRVVRLSSTEVVLRWEPSEQEGVMYRIYADGMRSVGLTRWHTYTSSGRVGARESCYRVAAVDSESRESPPSNEVCARRAAAGTVSQR